MAAEPSRLSDELSFSPVVVEKEEKKEKEEQCLDAKRGLKTRGITYDEFVRFHGLDDRERKKCKAAIEESSKGSPR